MFRNALIVLAALALILVASASKAEAGWFSAGVSVSFCSPSPAYYYEAPMSYRYYEPVVVVRHVPVVDRGYYGSYGRQPVCRDRYWNGRGNRGSRHDGWRDHRGRH